MINIRHILVLSGILILILNSVYNFAYPQQLTWSRTYGDSGIISEQGIDILQTYDGNYSVLASRCYDGNNLKILLVKFDQHGNLLWEKLVADSILHHNPYRFQQTSDSGFIITGVSGSAFLIKTDKNGNLQWRKVYTSTYPQTFSYCVINSPDNGFIFCGRVPFPNPPSDKGYIVRTDAMGIVQWERVYQDSLFSSYSDLVLNSDGSSLFVSGGTYNITQPLTYYSVVKKLDMNGDIGWQSVFGKNSSSGNILLLDDSSLILNASRQSSLSPRIFRIDTTGKIIWDQTFSSPTFSGGISIICKDPQNNIQKVGDYFNNVAYSEFSPSGQQMVLRPFQLTGFLATGANVIKNCNDGGFIVIGIAATGTQSHPKLDLLILKTDSAGNAPALTGIINTNVIVPSDFHLSQNYPNPFNPSTVIRFDITSPDPTFARSNGGFVQLKVYDVLGKEITTLVNEKMNPGSYSVQFDGSNFTSGIYFYKLEVDGNLIDTKRMMLLK